MRKQPDYNLDDITLSNTITDLRKRLKGILNVPMLMPLFGFTLLLGCDLGHLNRASIDDPDTVYIWQNVSASLPALDARQINKVNYGSINYTISPAELQDYKYQQGLCSGLTFRVYTKKRDYLLLNHGALVAKPGEPSLQRLLSQIVNKKDCSEKKIQKVLDFVSKHIQYNYQEAAEPYETAKGSVETLLMGNADCSGKVILMASLLDQLNVDYRLLYLHYLKNNHDQWHITVAVGGDFPNHNKQTFIIDGQSFHLADPSTEEGFTIGETILVRPYQEQDIVGFQKPGKNAPIFNFSGGTYPFEK